MKNIFTSKVLAEIESQVLDFIEKQNCLGMALTVFEIDQLHRKVNDHAERLVSCEELDSIRLCVSMRQPNKNCIEWRLFWEVRT